jgi:hypothetical protein
MPTRLSTSRRNVYIRVLTSNTTSKEFGPRVYDCWIIVTLEFGERAFCSLYKSISVSCFVEPIMLASYAPNLIADSGITLTTFNPFPTGVRRILSRKDLAHLPAYRLRIPPACHSSFIATTSGVQARTALCKRLPDFAAATTSDLTPVCAIR